MHNLFAFAICVPDAMLYLFFCVSSSMDSSRLDDEHKLIARYAQRLAQEARTMVSPLTFLTFIYILYSFCAYCLTQPRDVILFKR